MLDGLHSFVALRSTSAFEIPKHQELELGHGSLLLMRGGLQRDWKHSVPKTSRAVGIRINLGYRLIC